MIKELSRTMQLATPVITAQNRSVSHLRPSLSYVEGWGPVWATYDTL